MLSILGEIDLSVLSRINKEVVESSFMRVIPWLFHTLRVTGENRAHQRLVYRNIAHMKKPAFSRFFVFTYLVMYPHHQSVFFADDGMSEFLSRFRHHFLTECFP